VPVNLAVVDDYPLVVAGLHSVLQPFASRVRLRSLSRIGVRDDDLDVVLHDPAPGSARLSLDARGPSVRRLPRLAVFSWLGDAERLQVALARGADAHLSKTLPAEELVDAVERVSRGERVGMQASGPASGAVDLWPGVAHGLSGREAEVLMWICQGVSNREISERAFIGLNTVKTYIRSCYRKIGVTTRPQAVIWAMSHGFGPFDGRRAEEVRHTA
jgi:NarL family two-component system response regulator LiaR